MRNTILVPLILVLSNGFAQDLNDIAIRKESTAFSANYVAGDFTAMTNAYTEDAVLMPPSRDVVIGKKAIGEFWNASSRPIMHKCVPDRIVIDGNTAHDYGYFFTQSQKPGEEPGPVYSAKYYILWAKDSLGKWRMKMDMWNSRRSDWNK